MILKNHGLVPGMNKGITFSLREMLNGRNQRICLLIECNMKLKLISLTSISLLHKIYRIANNEFWEKDC